MRNINVHRWFLFENKSCIDDSCLEIRTIRIYISDTDYNFTPQSRNMSKMLQRLLVVLIGLITLFCLFVFFGTSLVVYKKRTRLA